jgi:hypothetical protein
MGNGTPRARLRAMLSKPGIIVSPCIWDPYTARVAERLGFQCVGIGGYVLGTHLVTSEPLLTLTEVANTCRYITATVQMTNVDPALAIKTSIPCPTLSGDLADTDAYGGQQYGPLVDLEVP